MKRRRALVALTVAGLAGSAVIAASSASASHRAAAAPASASAVSGSITVMAVWTGAEQKAFTQVIAGFKKVAPGVKVKYTAAGNDLPTVLGTAVTGGHPPDIAALPQPGLMVDFAKRGKLKPITFAGATISKNYAPVYKTLGTVSGKLYGVVFKGANKSTVWYSPKAFKNAGVKPPTTWTALLAAAKTLRASGTPAYSIGGSDGWTLTDLFENIYLRQAGAAKYDQLSTHKIKWTDASVKAALKTMAQVLGDTKNIAGGTTGALQTDFPTSVSQVFSANKAAMVFEGDFVQGNIKDANKTAKAGTDYGVFAFPSINGSGPTVVGGGDTISMFKDTPAGRAFINYLVSPAAASIWAHLGGFASPNKGVKPSVYPDAITRTTASALATAKTFRFDMSDLQPAAFGGTVGQGEFKLFQDFLKSPSNVDGIASQFEAAAAKAYK